jgi:predicted Zn-dependent protease
MAKPFRYKTTLGILMLLASSAQHGACQQPRSECWELHDDDTPSSMLAYLQQDRGTLPYSCIETAIRRLAEVRYKPAIKTLIEYLDLKEPGPPYLIRPSQATAGLYPAAVALSRMGDVAIPELKKAISSNENTKVLRVNAAETYLSMARDQPAAISFLVKTARSSLEPETGDALLRLAKHAAKGCREKDQQRCQEALNEQ